MDSIKLKRITDVKSELYGFAEKLMSESFPLTEYQPEDERALVEKRKPHYYLCAIMNENDEPVGCVAFWKLKRFIFIDHLAVSENHRNSGYGGKLLNFMKRRYAQPIVLEVEPPETILCQRRIGFYERNGFVLWKSDYEQPPYHKEDPFFKLCLMCYGNLNESEDFYQVRRDLYSEVYSY